MAEKIRALGLSYILMVLNIKKCSLYRDVTFFEKRRFQNVGSITSRCFNFFRRIMDAV